MDENGRSMAGAWESGTMSQQVKENTRLASTWDGVTMPQAKPSGALGEPAGAKECPFEIHFDEGLTHTQPAGVPSLEASSSVRLRLDAPERAERNRAEELLTNPLSRFTEGRPHAETEPPPVLTELPAVSQAVAAPISAPVHPVSGGPGKAGEALGYMPELLRYAGEEVCFEEVRERMRHSAAALRAVAERAAAEEAWKSNAPAEEDAPGGECSGDRAMDEAPAEALAVTNEPHQEEAAAGSSEAVVEDASTEEAPAREAGRVLEAEVDIALCEQGITGEWRVQEEREMAPGHDSEVPAGTRLHPNARKCGGHGLYDDSDGLTMRLATSADEDGLTINTKAALDMLMPSFSSGFDEPPVARALPENALFTFSHNRRLESVPLAPSRAGYTVPAPLAHLEPRSLLGDALMPLSSRRQHPAGGTPAPLIARRELDTTPMPLAPRSLLESTPLPLAPRDLLGDTPRPPLGAASRPVVASIAPVGLPSMVAPVSTPAPGPLEPFVVFDEAAKPPLELDEDMTINTKNAIAGFIDTENFGAPPVPPPTMHWNIYSDTLSEASAAEANEIKTGQATTMDFFEDTDDFSFAHAPEAAATAAPFGIYSDINYSEPAEEDMTINTRLALASFDDAENSAGCDTGAPWPLAANPAFTPFNVFFDAPSDLIGGEQPTSPAGELGSLAVAPPCHAALDIFSDSPALPPAKAATFDVFSDSPAMPPAHAAEPGRRAGLSNWTAAPPDALLRSPVASHPEAGDAWATASAYPVDLLAEDMTANTKAALAMLGDSLACGFEDFASGAPSRMEAHLLPGEEPPLPDESPPSLEGEAGPPRSKSSARHLAISSLPPPGAPPPPLQSDGDKGARAPPGASPTLRLKQKQDKDWRPAGATTMQPGFEPARPTASLDGGSDEDPVTFRGLIRVVAAGGDGSRTAHAVGHGTMGWPPVHVHDVLRSASDPFTGGEQQRLQSLVLPRLRDGMGGFIEHPASEAPPRRTLSHGGVLTLGQDTWRVCDLVGSGAFARVYSVSLGSMGAAAKVSTPGNVWEWYVHTQLERRLGADMRQRFASAIELHAFGDAMCASSKSCSVLLQELLQGPSVQHVVNVQRKQGLQLPEALALFYTLDLLVALQALHSVNVLHADLKPDNLMVRCPDPAAIDTSAPFDDPIAGWAAHGVCLIDFGRSIDLELYPPDHVFASECLTETFECIEAREGRPWRHSIDLFAACACAHVMLHGEYIQLQQHGDGRWRPKLQLKRYWQVELWRKLFDTLLDAKVDAPHPNLGEIIHEISTYFDGSPAARKSLKEALRSQYASLKESPTL